VTTPARVSPALLIAVWLVALGAAALLLAATAYRTRDPDSRAYIIITTRLAGEPVSRWIAPQWWGAWAGQGLFREHPAGTFIPPALLARAGYPVAQSLFVVSLACQVLSLLLLAALASRLVPVTHARALVWALQVIPIAFVFRVRANQEYLLLAGLLLAVYGLDRTREGRGWGLAALAGSLFALAVKGVFALLAPVAGAIWLATRRPAARRPWSWLVAMAVAMPLAAWLYERAYVAVTGQSFLEYYLGSRMALEGSGSSLPFPLDKLANVAWYAGRVLWYAAPWSVGLLLAFRPGAWRETSSGARTWIGFTLLAAAATVVLVAARDTKADRYVFPAYFFAASAGVVMACARWPRVAALADRLDRFWPWGPAVLWLLLVAGRIAIR
jgi:4-amino-4-deoxy-L-arabinose transferase-like glycosyltransferase